MAYLKTHASSPGGIVHYDRYIPTIGGFQPSLSMIFAAGNRILYSPIIIPFGCTIDEVGCVIDTPSAGSIRFAIFDSLNEAPNNRLALSALVVPGVTDQKFQLPIGVPPEAVVAGYYFLAVVGSTWNDAIFGSLPVFDIMNPAGVTEGPSWYYEDYIATNFPGVATPVQQYNQPALLWARVSSVP